MTLKTLWFVLIPLAIGACTAQWQLTQEPSVWEEVCADVAAAYEIDTCETYESPDIVEDSLLMAQMTGAYGVFVQPTWRIYIAPLFHLVTGGLTVDVVKYHEMVHAVLYAENITTERCSSERIAREMTDAKYGTNSANSGWEIGYRCVSPSQLL